MNYAGQLSKKRLIKIDANTEFFFCVCESRNVIIFKTLLNKIIIYEREAEAFKNYTTKERTDWIT
jgi:hypothetical protein